MKGKIVKIISGRGYGFINPTETDSSYDDIFFHHSALKNLVFDELEEGILVEFEIEETEKGPQANNIRELDADASADDDEFEDELEEENPLDEVDEEAMW